MSEAVGECVFSWEEGCIFPDRFDDEDDNIPERWDPKQ